MSALLAPACAVCGTVLDEALSGCVCRTCWTAIRPITPPVCDVCGDPLPRPDERCHVCSRTEHAVERSRSIGDYEGTLREVIHAMKYGGRRSLARPLAALMKQHGGHVLDGVDAVVPVPLHWRRQYQRGFNQARELARFLGPPLLDVLRRRRATRAQVELAADQRRANVAGAFVLRRCVSVPFRGRKLLLVDDVSTTGATLESCARVLRDAGASHVHALTAARVVSRHGSQAALRKPGIGANPQAGGAR